MQNNLDKIFLNLYNKVKGEDQTKELYKFINYSFIEIYLLVKGRAKYASNSTSYFKGLLYSYKEELVSRIRSFKVLRKQSFNSIVIINETSHLRHAIPLKNDVEGFKPLFLTNKKRFIKIIAKGFNTDNIIYIPKRIIGKSQFKNDEIKKVLSEFEIDTSESNSITSTLNNNYINYHQIENTINLITKKNNIKFTYIFNDLLYTGRVIIDLCNKKGIKTFYLMHGLLTDEFLNNIHLCKNYLVFGESSRKVLASKVGIDNDKIFTLGAPYLRELLKNKDKTFLVDELGEDLPKNKKIVLVLTSGPGHTTSLEHHKEILSVLKKVAQNKQDDFHFIFKLHRKDLFGYYNDIKNDKGLKNCDIYDFDHFQSRDSIFDWIKLAEIIITGASFTALEAMYIGKPVITVDLKREFENETSFIQEGATYHCRGLQEIYNSFDLLTNNNFSIKSKSKEIVNQYFADAVNIEKFHKEILTKQLMS